MQNNPSACKKSRDCFALAGYYFVKWAFFD